MILFDFKSWPIKQGFINSCNISRKIITMLIKAWQKQQLLYVCRLFNQQFSSSSKSCSKIAVLLSTSSGEALEK